MGRLLRGGPDRAGSANVSCLGTPPATSAAADAPAAIFGYCVGNDVTERMWQHAVPQWSLGKSFDTHAPMGPWIVTADELDRIIGAVLEYADGSFNTILELEAEMRQAASELQFELAARLRDEVSDMKRTLRDIQRHG